MPCRAMRMGLFALGLDLTDRFPFGELVGECLVEIFVGDTDGGHGSRLAHGPTQLCRIGGEAVEGDAVKGGFIG